MTDPKDAIRADPYASFDDQEPRLRAWLQSLPILEPEAPALRAFPAAAITWKADQVIAWLRDAWWGHHAPGTQEGAVRPVLGDEPDVIEIAFRLELWGKTTEVGHVTVARVDEDAFLQWPDQPTTGVRPVLGALWDHFKELMEKAGRV